MFIVKLFPLCQEGMTVVLLTIADWMTSSLVVTCVIVYAICFWRLIL